MAISDRLNQALISALCDHTLGSEIKGYLDNVSVLSGTEAAYIDGITEGTVTAQKAVVVDSNKDITGFRNIGLTGEVSSSSGAGTAAGTGVAATEKGDGIIHKTVLTFTNVAVPLTDEPGVVAYGGLKVYDFPEGAIRIFGAVSDVDLTKSSAGVIDTWDGDMSVGTATAGNDATLSGTEADIIPSTATPQAVAGATTANAQSTASEDTVHDGTTTAKDVYFNLLVDDTDHDVTTTPCNLILNGTLTILWANLGDY